MCERVWIFSTSGEHFSPVCVGKCCKTKTQITGHWINMSCDPDLLQLGSFSDIWGAQTHLNASGWYVTIKKKEQKGANTSPLLQKTLVDVFLRLSPLPAAYSAEVPNKNSHLARAIFWQCSDGVGAALPLSVCKVTQRQQETEMHWKKQY